MDKGFKVGQKVCFDYEKNFSESCPSRVIQGVVVRKKGLFKKSYYVLYVNPANGMERIRKFTRKQLYDVDILEMDKKS